MPDIRKRKGFVFFMMIIILLSFVRAVSVESPVTTSMVQTETAEGKRTVTFEAAGDTRVDFSGTLVYRAPSGRERISEGRMEMQETEGRTTRSRRYQSFRFLAVAFVMFLLPQVVVHLFLTHFSSSFIEIWENIQYIHWVDGKKGIRFLASIG